jgi:hypothetical protein
MCLIVPKDQQPVVTTEDMTVYKKVSYNLSKLPGKADRPAVVTHVYGHFQPFAYKLGERYTTAIQPTNDFIPFDKVEMDHIKKTVPNSDFTWDWDNFTSYGPGFHSCSTPDRLRKNELPDGTTPGPLTDLCIVECTVPAGSTVYASETGLFVSDNIVVNRILEDTRY